VELRDLSLFFQHVSFRKALCNNPEIAHRELMYHKGRYDTQIEHLRSGVLLPLNPGHSCSSITFNTVPLGSFTALKNHMDYDEEKVDEMVLALLYLTTFRDKLEVRTWKGLDWESLNRLHGKGYISDPRSKAKSVMLSQERARLSEELFRKHFGKSNEGTE
jgi:hypothetical protein